MTCELQISVWIMSWPKPHPLRQVYQLLCSNQLLCSYARRVSHLFSFVYIELTRQELLGTSLQCCLHVARANRVCTHCGSVAVADELHMIFECSAVQAVRQQYAPLFSTDTNTTRSFFAQQDHMQGSKIVLDCLDVFHI